MRLTPAVLIGLAMASCGYDIQHSKPSILLAVFDTARSDAVSAYGRVSGTTQTVDALAASGLTYIRAYSQAPWTLPSHATLFTGLLPSGHGVGWRNTWASDSLVMLAEYLEEAGYTNVGVSENPWVSQHFNMVQGFAEFAVDPTGSRMEEIVASYLQKEALRPPFFLFLNIMDSHAPYEGGPDNPYLPPGMSAADARRVPQNPPHYLCRIAWPTPELAALRGLYLGDVRAADAKLGGVLRQLRDAGLGDDLITVVASDHGEHFGEKRLVDHQFSVREPLIQVPLVVSGLAGVAPGVIRTPVRLADVMPTMLQWANAEIPEGLFGQPLPTTDRAPEESGPVIAEWWDPQDEHPADQHAYAVLLRAGMAEVRKGCDPAKDRIFGKMRALIDFPMKLVWFADYPAELYDIESDPGEGRDLAATHTELVKSLTAELERELRTHGRAPEAESSTRTSPLPAEVLEQLRALGYFGSKDTTAE